MGSRTIVIQHEDYAAQFQRWYVDPTMTVVRLEGRIQQMWVVMP